MTPEIGQCGALMQSAIIQMARRRAHPPALKAFALKDVADAHRFLGSPDLLGKIASRAQVHNNPKLISCN